MLDLLRSDSYSAALIWSRILRRKLARWDHTIEVGTTTVFPECSQDDGEAKELPRRHKDYKHDWVPLVESFHPSRWSFNVCRLEARRNQNEEICQDEILYCRRKCRSQLLTEEKRFTGKECSSTWRGPRGPRGPPSIFGINHGLLIGFSLDDDILNVRQLFYQWTSSTFEKKDQRAVKYPCTWWIPACLSPREMVFFSWSAFAFCDKQNKLQC